MNMLKASTFAPLSNVKSDDSHSFSSAELELEDIFKENTTPASTPSSSRSSGRQRRRLPSSFLSKSNSLKHLLDEDASSGSQRAMAAIKSISEQEGRKPRFSVSMSSLHFSTESSSYKRSKTPNPQVSRRGSLGETKGLGKINETLKKKLNKALNMTPVTTKRTVAPIGPEEMPSTPALSVVKVKGSHLQLLPENQIPSQSSLIPQADEADVMSDPVEDSPEQPKRPSGLLKRMKSLRDSSNRLGSNSKSSPSKKGGDPLNKSEHTTKRHRSKSKNGRLRSSNSSLREESKKVLKKANSMRVGNSSFRDDSKKTSSTRRSRSQDQHHSRSHQDHHHSRSHQDHHHHNRSASKKLNSSNTSNNSQQENNRKQHRSDRSKSRDRTQRKTRTEGEGKRDRSKSRDKSRARPTKKMETSQSEMSSSRNRDNQILRRARSFKKLDVSNNNSSSDHSGEGNTGHRRSSRLALKRAAGHMTTNKQTQQESTTPREPSPNKDKAVARPCLKKAKSQSALLTRNKPMSPVDAAAVAGAPGRRRARMKKAASQSALTPPKDKVAPALDAANKKVSFVALQQVTQADAGAISIDDLDSGVTPKVLKGKVSLQSLMRGSPLGSSIPNLEPMSVDTTSVTKEVSLDTLIKSAISSSNSSEDGDGDSTIVSMAGTVGTVSIDTCSDIEKAVHDAFQQAIEEAVIQHTKSISSTAANNLIQKLREG